MFIAPAHKPGSSLSASRDKHRQVIRVASKDKLNSHHLDADRAFATDCIDLDTA